MGLFWVLFSLLFLISATFCMALAAMSSRISRIEERMFFVPVDNEEEIKYNVHKEETDK